MIVVLVLLVPLAGRPAASLISDVVSGFSRTATVRLKADTTYVEIASRSFGALQSPRDGGCTEWHDCRQLALAAADRGEYEIFHDLAWRTVQTGPPKDPALM